MNISNEDALRLNVLMQQPVEAVRINESTMTLYALLPDRELNMRLSPNCNDERYLRQVRQLLSGFALNSPEGFPVYLQRWNRMGQIKSEKLEGLLKIGEPEAVLAVVQSQNLTYDIARRAWWCMTNSENACHLLEHQLVRDSELAKELVNFLIEFLPFEEDPLAMIKAAQQAVRAGVMQEEELKSLWQKGKRRAGIRLGFLAANPTIVPEDITVEKKPKLLEELDDNNLRAGIEHLFGESGQKFIKGMLEVLDRIPNQDAAIFMCDTIHRYFQWANPLGLAPASWEAVPVFAQRLNETFGINVACMSATNQAQWNAISELALVSQNILNPILSQTDSVGTVMRKRLLPVTQNIQQRLEVLINK